MIVNSNGISKEFSANSSAFTKEQIAEMHKLKPGQRILFSNIQARGSDGTTRTLKGFSLVVR